MQKLAKRIIQRCARLALCSESRDGIVRLALSEKMKEAAELVKQWMAKVHLSTIEDDAGNIIGVGGCDSTKPTLAMGSHFDTVVNAGKYDGVLGLLIAIELASFWHQKMPFNIQIIGFSDEEGARFQTKWTGSKSVCGLLDKSVLVAKDGNGVSMRDAITAYGGTAANIFTPRYMKGDLLGFLEFHIEQGISLQQEGKSLGIVESIVGQANLSFEFLGMSGHAGTLAMYQRHDSLAAVANLIIAVEDYAFRRKGLVATVGMINNFPNMPNSVSGNTLVSVDIRHANNKIRAQAVRDIIDIAKLTSKIHGQKLRCRQLGGMPSVDCDSSITDLIEKSMGGIPHIKLNSGAGHDAMIMASVCPIGMVFIRCKNGISHHPLESVSVLDVGNALALGKSFMTQMAHKVKNDS